MYTFGELSSNNLGDYAVETTRPQFDDRSSFGTRHWRSETDWNIANSILDE